MLNQIIDKVSREFIYEAMSSPNLLEDMASMEKYMSESYSGRIFVELLQNADDSGSNKILLTLHGKDIIFANDGRCFNESDIIAISRSGSSAKERGTTIGYRGVGFKSTTYLTNEIIIYSDDTYFTFSKSTCARVLKKVADKVPTVRIPFFIQSVDDQTDDYITQLKRKGYTTIFIFKNAEIREFEKELEDVNNGCFLFLNNLLNCTINIGVIKKNYEIVRNKQMIDEIVSIRGNTSEQWLIVRKKKASVAFKYENDEIMPCADDDAVYHCYLPTLDKVVFPIKVNCDFSTDPSRKHLTSDSITNHAILEVAELLFQIVSNVFAGKTTQTFSNILIILLKKTSFSRLNSMLKERFQELLSSQKWILLNNGTCISAKDYKTLPDWFEESEKSLIRNASPLVKELSLNIDIYKNIPFVEEFLNQYSISKYSINDLIEILKDEKFVATINQQTHGKILGNIIKSGKTSLYIRGEICDYSEILLPMNQGFYTLKDISKENSIELSDEFKEIVNQIADGSEIEWFCNKNCLKSTMIQKEPQKEQRPFESLSPKCNLSRPIVSRWRSAEQQCVEMEIFLGNTAKDVSKQNVGYDVESTTRLGEKRYIEVKLLNGSGGSFSITNNEYTAAHQYGEGYYLCLISQSNVSAQMTYIRNPLETLSFEKRIRQWEWYCEQYSGEEYSIEFK